MLTFLTSIDEVLYEVLTYLVLVVKTLIKVFFKPSWIHRYIEGELKKERAERFKDYAQPVIFFVLVGVLPLIRVLSFLATFKVAGDTGEMLADFRSLDTENGILAVFLFLVSWPLAAALVVLFFHRVPLSRDTLRPFFYSQAYCFGVYYLLSYLALPAFLSIVIWKQNPHWFLMVMARIAVVSTLWLPYCQTRIIRDQLSIGVWKAVGILILCYIASLVLAVLCDALLVLGMIYSASGSHASGT